MAILFLKSNNSMLLTSNFVAIMRFMRIQAKGSKGHNKLMRVLITKLRPYNLYLPKADDATKLLELA